MFTGSLAIAIVVIIGFTIFIAWAKTATGKTTLRNTIGDPHSLRKRQRMAKRRATTSAPPVKKTTKRN